MTNEGMTNEEAIEYNKNLREYMRITDKDSEYKFLKENYEALDMAIKALESQRWIPVSEKPQEGRYLCTYEHCDGKCIDFGSFDGEAWYIKPIAYMPLPQPYAESEEKE